MADRPLIPLFGVNMCPGAASAVADVLVSGQIAEGPTVKAFEEAIAEFFGLRGENRVVVTVNSGTSALELALLLAGVQPGDDVLTSPMTCTATTTAIINRGARPVWVDVDDEGNLDPADISKRWTPKTKAVMVVEWAGRPVDINAVRAAAPGVAVIEDAAHAFTFNRHLQTADFRCFSFQAIKHLTTGDGGAVIMHRDEENRARRLRWFGLDRSLPRDQRLEEDQFEVGHKWHMNDIAATIGLVNLGSVVERALDACLNNAYAYDHALRDIGSDHLRRPGMTSESAWWLYTVQVQDRAAFQTFMARRGIETSEVHRRNDRVAAFAAIAGPTTPGDFPGLDRFAAAQVSVPVGWWLTKPQRDVVANALVDFAQRGG